MRALEELLLDTRAGEVALLHWPAVGARAQKLLCLHGWLDNAASFVPLAQHLNGVDIFALDFPGHGHSAHRKAGVRYTIAEYLCDIDAVLDALGWEQANLLGHSLGGGTACLYAAASPERIRRLAVLDGLGPLTMAPEKTAQQLTKSLEWLRRERKPKRQFDSIDEMAEARRSAMHMSPESARLICERAATEVEGEIAGESGSTFVWRNDPALNWHSPVLLTEPQVLNCLSSIKAPVLSIHAQPLFHELLGEVARERMTSLQDGRFVELQGTHHFHMDMPEKVAPHIEEFINEGTDQSD